MIAPTPWRSHRSTLIDAEGHSIASGGNNRVVLCAQLHDSLKLAAAAPELREVVRLFLKAGVGNSTDFGVQAEATMKARELLSQVGAL